MAKLPNPPPSLTRIPAIVTRLPAGTRLWRVYFAGGTYPGAWDAFRSYGPTNARFDHHDLPPSVQHKSILYAARDPATCLAEVFQGSRVIDRHSGQPWLGGFDTAIDLTLLDLASVWPTRAGASMAINSGPRPRARAWSRVIWAAYPDIHGVYYPSSMHANAPSVALYERGQVQGVMPAAPVFNRALSDRALASRLGAAASRLGYSII
jgi:hypothetical protein